jgi:hypothetical protein
LNSYEVDARLRVRLLMTEARRQAGGGPKFSRMLAEAGVMGGKGDEPYDPSTIAAWCRGTSAPPAHVLVAAVELTDMPQTILKRNEVEHRDIVDEVREQLINARFAALEADVLDIREERRRQA